VLLGFPLDVSTAGFGNLTADVRRADLEWYAAITDAGGPAMTWSMHAIGYVELGDPASAAPLFNRSFANVAGPFAVWFEEVGEQGTPNFLTGAGGFLQALIYGYPGLRINDTALNLAAPTLPEGSSKVRLRGVAYRGNRLLLEYDGATMTVALLTQADTVIRRTHEYKVPSRSSRPTSSSLRPASPPVAGDLSLLPRAQLSLRSQSGQVVIGGRRLAATPLVLVDASGGRHPLSTVPLSLPLQRVAIVAAT